jgi:hypothetical protein
MQKKISYKIGSILSISAVLLSPIIASAAVDSGTTTVNASVTSTIAITTNPTITINLQPGASAVLTSVSDTVSVSTNSSNGYNLKLSDGDTTTTLVSGANTIAAHAGTYASPTAMAANTWGYRIVGQGGFTATAYVAETNATSSTSTWAGVASSAAPVTVKTTGTTAASDPTVVWYAVKVDASKPNGTYTDTVTYTATTNS